jgi:hypothetical protein
MTLFITQNVFAQMEERKYFAGYELLEMTMNKFQNFAGEIGCRFNEKEQVRLTVMEVVLTERHLSNGYEAFGVDGSNVQGYFRNYEINYDRYFSEHWYYSINISYDYHKYEHTIIDASVNNETMTIGSGIGYTHYDLFGIKHLFLNCSVPVRYFFNHLEETKLGGTTIRAHIIVNNIWLFIGYNF